MDIHEIQARLSEPFHPKRVHWRLGSTNQKKVARETGDQYAKPTKGMPLAYIDARDVMERLDEVCGIDGWQDTYREEPSGRVICQLHIRMNDEWIIKTDGAGDTSMEGAKGAISDALKRAAVKFGVARYLYAIESGWIDLDNGYIPKSWLDHTAPKLLPTYKPSIYNDWRKFTDALMEHSESILKIKQWLAEEDIESAKAEWLAVSNDDKMALNRPWTRGGVWTPQETKVMKSW